jgi:isopenicillin-N N-acyltransferase-like protein
VVHSRSVAWLVIVTLIAGLVWPALGHACTLFAAAGERVKGGGTLIAKNRDWRPDNTQILKLVSPKAGHRYFGLYAEGNDEPGLKAGINEKGLVVVSATASTPRKELRSLPRTTNLLGKLLNSSATVDEALRHGDWFLGPRYVLIADRNKAASIEIAPGGNYRVAVTDRSVLYHTNHYVMPDLEGYNPVKIGPSSLERYRRVEELLGQGSQFDLEDFIRISEDRSGGPDNSLWRDGSKPNRARSLAAWIVYLPETGEPQIYVKTANPNQAPVLHRQSFREAFR